MKSRMDASGVWLLHLEQGEPFRTTVEGFMEQNRIQGGWLSAVGCAENPELALFDPGTHELITRRFDGYWELVSASGNVGLRSNRPVVHVRASITGYNELAGRDFEVFGGRLVDFKVFLGLEVFIRPTHEAVERVVDETSGLAFWKL